MGVTTFAQEFALAVPPARLFKAIVIDGDNLLPKLMPQSIKNIETIQGDGGPGSIKHFNFAEGSGYNYAKERIEEIDEVNYVSKYTMIEGDGISEDTVESISFEFKFEAGANGGSVCKMISHYHTKGEFEIITEMAKAEKEQMTLVYKTVEAYLLANPNACV